MTTTLFSFLIKHAETTTAEPPPFKAGPCEEFEYVLPHMSYEETVAKMKEWESKAPDLVEVGTFGKTSDGTDQYYMRICNEKNPSDKKVLVTACIHGNEPWSASTTMAYAGNLIVSYGRDAETTDLVDSRIIYFVPVVSPDSYPNRRSSEGKDPNRSFPAREGESEVSSVRNLQRFFLKIKPNSVLSGHTYGRLYLIPWGDKVSDNPNLSDYKRIAERMCELSGYGYKKACQMYGRPIYGSEMDWFHRNGAFAMVSEFGTHQKKPSVGETEKEFERTREAFLHFVRESVKVDIVDKCSDQVNKEISIRVLILKHSKEKMADDDAKMVMKSISKASSESLDVKTIGDHWIDEANKIRVALAEYDEISNLKEFVSERLSVGAKPRDTVIIFTVGHGSPSGYLHNVGSRTEMQKALAEAAEENDQKVMWWQLSCYSAAKMPPLGSLSPRQRSLFSVLNTSDAKTPSPAYIEAGIMEKLFSGMINSDPELDRDRNMEITGTEFARYMNAIKRGRGDLLRMDDIHSSLFGLSIANQIPIAGEGIKSLIPTPSRK